MSMCNKVNKGYFDKFIASVPKKVEVDFVDRFTQDKIEEFKDFNTEAASYIKGMESTVGKTREAIKVLKAKRNELVNCIIISAVCCLFLLGIPALVVTVRALKQMDASGELQEKEENLKLMKNQMKGELDKKCPNVASMLREIQKDFGRGFSVTFDGKTYSEDAYEVLLALNALKLTDAERVLLLYNLHQGLFTPVIQDDAFTVIPIAEKLAPLREAEDQSSLYQPMLQDLSKRKRIEVIVGNNDIFIKAKVKSAPAVRDSTIQEGDIVGGKKAKQGDAERPICALNVGISCSLKNRKMKIIRSFDEMLFFK